MSLSSGSLSAATRLDIALAQLRRMSGATAFSSSQSSPLTSSSPGLVSPVFVDVMDFLTTEQQQTKGKSYRTSREENSNYDRPEDIYSPLYLHSSDPDGGRNGHQTTSLDSSDLNSNTTCEPCTCCPYGKHTSESLLKRCVLLSYGKYRVSQHVACVKCLLKRRVHAAKQTHDKHTMQTGSSGGYYTIRPTHRSRHLSSLSDNYTNGGMMDKSSRSHYSRNHQHATGDSRHYSSELFSPESPISPSSSSSDMETHGHSRNVVMKTTRTVTSSNILPNTDENESLTISPEAIKQIKQHTEDSNKLIRELQDQLKFIPQMQERIKLLKEEKRLLANQLQSKSGVSSMRSVGVGDYDVDEDHVRVERVKQTVIQQPLKPHTRGVGVGVYDVNTELYTQADIIHTVAEHVQKIREREIQTWIQEAEAAYEARKASTRSFGVGEKDVWDEENRLIKEREMRTIVIGNEKKPSQRNVGLQVKPSMRDVCIEYSHQDTKPTTRSCGFNVDVGDLIQEMATQGLESLDVSPQQQQQNSWKVQKHVIQRKFMEAMTTGRQEDLVKFITGLLKRSVRSVGTTVKPSTADFGVTMKSRGVGDDVVDVIVKPFVYTKDSFTLAKPSMRTQPTWTDLILTCDAGTNTQKCEREKGVNTSPPPEYKNVSETITTTTERRAPVPLTQRSIEHSGTTHVSQTFHRPPSQERCYRIKPPAPANINQMVTETTVTERRSSNTQPEIERKYHSHVDKIMSPPAQPVELDITLPSELTAAERRVVTEESLRQSEDRTAHIDELHRSEMHMILPGHPDPLTPLTVQVLPNTAQGGEIASSTHTLLAKTMTSDRNTISTATGDVLDTSLSPRHHLNITDDRSSMSRSGQTRARSLPASHNHSQVSSSSMLVSPSLSSTKRVVSEERPYTSLKETTEHTEAGGVVKKETVIERRFSSSSNSSSTRNTSRSTSDRDAMSTSLTDFDYFGTNHSNMKPTGHAERMERYGGAITYTSTGTDVDKERNKTELHGNPLNSKYTIEEMSGGSVLGSNAHTVSASGTETMTPKSLLKDRDSPRVKKPGVKFADQVDNNLFSFNSEINSACSILQRYLQAGGDVKSSKEAAASSLVEGMWFDIGSSRTSDAARVSFTCKLFSERYSPSLLAYVINMADGNGNTALHYAVSNANYEVMKVLLQTGAINVNLQNKAGYTPVMLASLCEISSEEERRTLRLLLLNADVNISAKQAGQTALMLAVAHGKVEMAKLLLEVNSDVNLQDFDGSTALMCAAEHNHLDVIVALLANRDINVLIKDNEGSTALDVALENGHEAVAELLQKAEDNARIRRAAGRRSTSRIIPSTDRKDNSRRASSSPSSSKSYTSKFV